MRGRLLSVRLSMRFGRTVLDKDRDGSAAAVVDQSSAASIEHWNGSAAAAANQSSTASREVVE